MKYTYNPALISDGDLNQMRFELGDCLLDEPEKTAYLSDEEICAALASDNYQRAKFRLVESLLRRFSYEVDTKIKEAEWKMSGRVAAWERIYRELKAQFQAQELTRGGFSQKKYPAPFFKRGLHDLV